MGKKTSEVETASRRAAHSDKKRQAEEKRNKKCKIYLITSREQGQWIIPTGKLEKNLSNRRVALLEAFEEAGILGKLDEEFKVQVLLQSPRGKKKRKTIVFLLYVKRILNHWPEQSERKRKSVSIQAYVKTVSDKKFKRKILAI